jgi:hypothetical protein
MTVRKFGRTPAIVLSGRRIPDWVSRQEEIAALHDAIRMACLNARVFLGVTGKKCGGADRTRRT